MIAYFFDRSSPSHYWRWIKWSWVVMLMGTIPTAMAMADANVLPIFISLLAVPFFAHLYGFIMNMKALKNWDEPGRTGPAIILVTYLIASVISSFFIGIELAFTMGFAAVVMTVISFGIIFTGFAPFLGMWLVSKLFNPSIDTRGFVIAMTAMTAAWLIAIMTGYALGNVG